MAMATMDLVDEGSGTVDAFQRSKTARRCLCSGRDEAEAESGSGKGNNDTTTHPDLSLSNTVVADVTLVADRGFGSR